MWYMFLFWVVALVIEFITFSSILVNSHTVGELVFYSLIIIATLFVGITGIFLYFVLQRNK